MNAVIARRILVMAAGAIGQTIDGLILERLLDARRLRPRDGSALPVLPRPRPHHEHLRLRRGDQAVSQVLTLLAQLFLSRGN
jgi:hypothetical protein